MHRLLSCAVVCVFLVTACVPTRGATVTSAVASVQGSLTAQDGSAVAGAKISAYFSAPLKNAPPPSGPTVTGLFQLSAVTDSSGNFKLSNLLPGTYTLCAQAAGINQIDPCHWGQAPPTVTVTAGQSVADFKISLAKGSVLNIRLDDPSHYLNGPKTSQGLPHVTFGIYTTAGHYYPAYLASKDATGMNYTVTIPLNTPLRLGVSSRHVKLVDSSGTAIPLTGAVYPFRHDSVVDNSKPVEFKVTGSY